MAEKMPLCRVFDLLIDEVSGQLAAEDLESARTVRPAGNFAAGTAICSVLSSCTDHQVPISETLRGIIVASSPGIWQYDLEDELIDVPIEA